MANLHERSADFADAESFNAFRNVTFNRLDLVVTFALEMPFTIIIGLSFRTVTAFTAGLF